MAKDSNERLCVKRGYTATEAIQAAAGMTGSVKGIADLEMMKRLCKPCL